MELYILSEPLFMQSPWYRSIYGGLVGELSKRKLTYCNVDSDKPLCNRGGDAFVFVLGTNINWLSECISRCECHNIHPIVLSTQKNDKLCGNYSIVTSNISHSINYLLSYLCSLGKKRTALFGVNKLSLTNLAQMEQFKSNTYLSVSDSDIYFNNGSISDCSDMFMNNISKYDSVISVNDFATISLMRKLSETDKSLTIVSYGGTKLAEKYFPNLLTVSMGYEDFGKAALSVCDILKNNSDIDSVVISVKCKIANKQGDDYEMQSKQKVYSGTEKDMFDKQFYNDTEMNDMLRIENMLLLCDETDSKIINLLMLGFSYEEIAEKLFCALNTVKYRVKKMKENCNCVSKKEMINIIRNYCEI